LTLGTDAFSSCLVTMQAEAAMRFSLDDTAADEIARLDGHAQAGLVRNGEIPPAALVEAAILRIERIDPSLNAICHRAFDHARGVAATVDRSAAMAAVPYLIKSSLEYPGFPVDAGSRARRGEIARRAFPLAKALDGAGMIPVGLSAMPEFGLNATSETALHGPTRNPWDPGRSAGGSSTGSAAAVAAGLVPFATASDAGGSIRLPASCCGIVGFKPSRGWNLRARAFNLVDDVLCSDGLYGRSMRDTIWAARLLRPSDKKAPPRPATGLRIALDLTGLDGHPPSAEIETVVRRSAALCEELGHHVEERSQTFDRAGLQKGFMTLWAYLGGEIADHYGDHAQEVLEPWTLGLGTRRATITPEDLAEALAQIDRAAAALADFHREVDVVLSPVTAKVTPPLGHLSPMQEPDRLWDALFGYITYTPLQNMAGTPGISLPLFATPTGLPIGTMFTADRGQDELLLALAAQLEQARPWHDLWPPAAQMPEDAA
jgi:amidase